jgi:hypothetical protein
MYTRVASSPAGSPGCTRTGISNPRSPVGSLANATPHSASLNFEAEYAGESTAIVRSALWVARCISLTKTDPGLKSNACSTVLYPARSSSTAIHSAHGRFTPV